jgi:5-(carboxyamino)imidazole ribonucleotide mutase
MKKKVVILMGSERDLNFCREIARYLKDFSIEYEFRVASAHKTAAKVLEIVHTYEKDPIIYITVAGRSNALSAFVDAHTKKPVIACPPYSEKFCGADIFSTLRVPSGIGILVTIEPEGAAIAAAKIFAITDHDLAKQIAMYQQSKKKEIEKADNAIKRLR